MQNLILIAKFESAEYLFIKIYASYFTKLFLLVHYKLEQISSSNIFRNQNFSSCMNGVFFSISINAKSNFIVSHANVLENIWMLKWLKNLQRSDFLFCVFMFLNIFEDNIPPGGFVEILVSHQLAFEYECLSSLI